jgi:hypothetical protein
MRLALSLLPLLIAVPLLGAPEATPAAPPKDPAAKPAPKIAPKPKPVIAFKPATLELMPGETFLVELFIPNPAGKEVPAKLGFWPGGGVDLTPDARWKGKLPRYGAKLYPKISAISRADGEIPVAVTVDGQKATLNVKIVHPTIEVVPAYKKLTVKVTSPFTERACNGRVEVSNPDRFLQDITTREFKLMPGQTAELLFPLPGAAAAESETYDFTVLVEGYHGFKDKKTHPLSFPSQPEQ